MKLKKSLHLALNIFFHSKLRSWLTIIGIVIGMAAVVAIVALSAGAQQQLESRLESLGADILTITPGATRAFGGGFGGGEFEGMPGQTSSSSTTTKNLTSREVNVLKTVSNVETVMGTVSGGADVVYLTKTVNSLSCTGVDILVWKDITTETLDSGRFLTVGDTYSVVIGKNLADSVFGKTISLNAKITIGGKSFTVVGILSEGRSVYIPLSIARVVLEDVGKDEFSSISVKIFDVNLATETVTDITNKLMMSRGILQENKKDFTVSNPEAMQETMQQTMSSMTLFLGAIAAISLIVGAIGIANTMFTSVLEKTKDIGVMKAIGAKNRDILSVFLLNSGLIGLVGGIGGVILGALSSTAINVAAGVSSTTSGGGRIGSGNLLGMLGGSAVISPFLIIGVLLFSIIIGMFAGVVPAYKASKMNPVDALRYE